MRALVFLVTVLGAAPAYAGVCEDTREALGAAAGQYVRSGSMVSLGDYTIYAKYLISNCRVAKRMEDIDQEVYELMRSRERALHKRAGVEVQQYDSGPVLCANTLPGITVCN